MKILIVEDDNELREIIVASLQRERYVVEEAPDFETACSKALIYEYDCILLDIMLPDGNGLDLLGLMYKNGRKSNVIILSAKDSIEDKVAGLELGADDYLPKPFHLAELNARLKSVLRRTQQKGSRTITCGNVTIDPDTFQVFVGEESIELGKKEYDMLLYLMLRPHRLIQKETLAEGVWGDDADQKDNFDIVYAHIKNLRKRLGNAGAKIEIRTVYGFGYKLQERE